MKNILTSFHAARKSVTPAPSQIMWRQIVRGIVARLGAVPSMAPAAASLPPQPASQSPSATGLGRRDVSSYSTLEAVARFDELPILRGRLDRHNGIHVNLDQLDSRSHNSFMAILRVSLCHWLAEKRCAAWLRVPIERSSLITEAAKLGFRFHHAENTSAMLYLWLRPNSECKIHPFATHQVGVAGCVVNSETSEILVVKDKEQSHSLWKFPGGVADLGENIAETAKREILEETGLHTEFQGILAFRQLHSQPNSFGRSDLFFVCHMTPLTFDMRPCSEEIAACRWIGLDEFERTGHFSAMTKRVVQLVRHGLRHGFSNVSIGCENHPSIYRGRCIDIYSRTSTKQQQQRANHSEYKHSIVDPLD
jgi:8-oxo-dGTP pyrophosphatase MutT (NUDIX family)